MLKVEWSEYILESLVESINDEKVIPVIGPGAYEVNGFKSVHEYIIKTLCEDYKLGVPPEESYMTDSLRGMTRFSKWFSKNLQEDIALHSALKTFFEDDNKMSRITLKPAVRKFLINGRFPLILTTCNFRKLEDSITHRAVKYDTIVYQKNPSGDLPQSLLREKSFIFYLFGVVDKNRICVINETDFLSYIHGYLGIHTPKNLKKYLSDRYILTLGCEIPDWTFRFLLYSLKVKDPTKENLKDSNGDDRTFIGGAIATTQMNDELADFLREIKYKPGDEIDNKLTSINKILPAYKPSIFLSMNSEEYDTLGKLIYDKLKEEFDVWLFSKQERNPQYWKKIEEGIMKCDYFMPVVTPLAVKKLEKVERLTNKIVKDDGVMPGLIAEWRIACEHKKKLGERLYCVSYLMDVRLVDFQRKIEAKDIDETLLKPLFLPGEGAESICSTDCPLKTFNSKVVWNHLKLQRI